MPKKRLLSQLLRLLRENKASSGRLRIQFNINAVEKSFDYFATLSPLKPAEYLFKRSGWKLGLFKSQKILLGDQNHFKSNNRSIYLLSNGWNIENGFDQSVVLNERNQVIDTTSCNIFWVKNGKIYTPLLKSGGVDGCFKRFLIKEEKHFGHKIKIKSCQPKTLLNADEIFVTNVIRGIQWISTYEGKTYDNTISKELFQRLKSWEGRI